MGVDGELRHAVLAHQPLQVGPDRVGTLGEHVGLLVEHLVEDLHALVGQADLVRVRIHQRPAHGDGVPVLDDGAQLAADVLDRLAHQREQPLQPIEHRRHGLATLLGNQPGYATAYAVAHRLPPLTPLCPPTARLAAWRYAFLTTNPPEQGVVDGVTRWLVVTRAGVLPMTLTSG